MQRPPGESAIEAKERQVRAKRGVVSGEPWALAGDDAAMRAMLAGLDGRLLTSEMRDRGETGDGENDRWTPYVWNLATDGGSRGSKREKSMHDWNSRFINDDDGNVYDTY